MLDYDLKQSRGLGVRIVRVIYTRERETHLIVSASLVHSYHPNSDGSSLQNSFFGVPRLDNSFQVTWSPGKRENKPAALEGSDHTFFGCVELLLPLIKIEAEQRL